MLQHKTLTLFCGHVGISRKLGDDDYNSDFARTCAVCTFIKCF